MIPEEALRLADEFVHSEKVGMLLIHKSPKTKEHPQGDFTLFIEETLRFFELPEDVVKAAQEVLDSFDALKVELHSGEKGFYRLRLSRKL